MKAKVNNQNCWQTIEGKIAVFIMAFSGDSECLCQCIRGLEEQKKKGFDLEIYICDDNNNPLNEEQVQAVQDKIKGYKKTYFERNCNLNGKQCAHGMLMEMLRCARESKAEFVMKVDCDMYIRDLHNFLKPLEEDRESVIGFKLNKDMNYCAGVTYLLPTSGLYNAVRDFYKWYKNEKENDPQWIAHCPEDWAITRCVTAVNEFTMVQWDNSCEPQNWLMSPFNFREIEEDGSVCALSFTRFQLYDFVNFGNRYELDQECKCKELMETKNPREIAGDCMRRFVDFDLLNIYQG